MSAPPYLRDAPESLALIPRSASSLAPQWDALFLTLLAISVFIVLLIGALILYFSIRYRAHAAVDRSGEISERRVLLIEASWTLATLAIFVCLFIWSAPLYLRMYQDPPQPAMIITAVGKQWMWKLQHPDGVREINELHVPVGQPIEVRIGSQDVIHSFAVPDFRVKRDAVPGRFQSLWFTATRPGVYALFCAEYCGTDHSLMRGRIIALNATDYARWLAQQDVPTSLATQGADLFRAYGCSGCHMGNSAVHAPSLVGLYGRTVALADGRQVLADENYLRDSILLPSRDVVAGYQPLMPEFRNRVTPADVDKLIAYIKSLTTQAHSALEAPSS